MTMQSISISDFGGLIEHVAIGHGDAVMGWGEPGIGKTMIVGQVAAKHNALIADLRLGQYDSVDMRGIPVPHAGQTVWHAPITIPFKHNPTFDIPENRDRPIILFLDEFNSAQTSVFAVAMQLTSERRIGEHELMDNVAIVACGNMETHRAVANRMPTTNANRLVHAELLLDVDGWCYWAQQAGLPAEAVAFHQFSKSRKMLSTFMGKDGPTTDKAFATPRTWEKALNYYADPRMPENIKMAAMAGAIGQGPSAEFWGFVDVWGKMPRMEDIEKNPNKVPVPDEAAMRYAVAVAVSGSMAPQNAAPFATYLERMDPEFGVLAWQLALRRDAQICGTPEFISFSKKYRAIFAR